MPITTLDGAIAGMRPPMPIIKTGIATAAVGAMRGYTPWYAPGNPGASTATAIGVNGEAVTPALGSVGGRIPRVNPSAGLNAYLGRLAMQASQAGTMWLIDRMWQNSGLSVTSAVGQPITSAALPARDNNGTANGAGVMAAIEWSATGGAGTPTVTLNYNDQDNNAGTGTFTAVASPPVGTFEIFTLGAGDTGIRSLTSATSFTQSATRTSGTQHLVLFRVLAQIDVTAANIGNAVDALTSGFPRLFDDTVLQLVWFPSVTTATNFVGQYIETQG
ncbi:MAG: hypothetical protein ABFD96_06020 [Armatimonadia bacterium]